MAGIKFKRIGIPHPEDVIKASTRKVLQKLEDVNEEVLPLFEDLTKVLIEQNDGDAVRALQMALAYCTGHYRHKVLQRSLLNGQDNMVTVKMTVQRGSMTTQSCYAILKKYWDPRVVDYVHSVKPMKDGMGVVFDIREEKWESFQDNF